MSWNLDTTGNCIIISRGKVDSVPFNLIKGTAEGNSVVIMYQGFSIREDLANIKINGVSATSVEQVLNALYTGGAAVVVTNDVKVTNTLGQELLSEATGDAIKTNTDTLNTNFGAQADAAAGSDTATASYISLFKRLVQQVSSLLSFSTNQNTGTYSNVMFQPSNMSPFGDLIVSEFTPIIQGDFTNGVNGQLYTTTVANGGTVTSSSSRLRLLASTNAASSSTIATIRPAKYRAGQGMVARFTAAFSNPTLTQNTRWFGVGTLVANALYDGYVIGVVNGVLSILHGNTGSITTINQSSFNVDTINGSGSSGFTINPENGNVFMIKYPFMGYGNIEFYVQNPATSRWILFHVIRYTNSSQNVQLSNPNLHFIGYNVNTGNTTECYAYCGSYGIFLCGERNMNGVQGGLNNNKALSAAGGRTNLITLANCTTYNGVPNKTIVRVDFISTGFGGFGTNAFGIIRATRNPTVGGVPSFTAFAAGGTSTSDGLTVTGTSVVSFDVAGTTVTGGITLWNDTSAQNLNSSQDVTEKELYLFPGDKLVFEGQVTGNGSMSVAINWTEEQ